MYKLSDKDRLLIINLIKLVINLYKYSSSKKKELDIYKLFIDMDVKDINKNYPILIEIAEQLDNVKKQGKLPISSIDWWGMSYNMYDVKQAILVYNKKVEIPGKDKLQKEKANAFFSSNFNTPSPDNFKITPLKNTAFEHRSSNNVLNFKVDWLVTSFYLCSEVNILIPAFFYIDKKSAGNTFSNIEKENYYIWLHKQINEYKEFFMPVLYGSNNFYYAASQNLDIDEMDINYLIDYTLDENMSREVYEDLVYVLLNLVLAKTINEHIEKLDINNISTEKFFDDIYKIIEAHHLKHSSEYKLLFELRKFSIDNLMSTYTLESMYYNTPEGKEKAKEIAEITDKAYQKFIDNLKKP